MLSPHLSMHSSLTERRLNEVWKNLHWGSAVAVAVVGVVVVVAVVVANVVVVAGGQFCIIISFPTEVELFAKNM